VNIYQAKTHFSELVARAAAGEEFIIAKAGEPMARLGALPAATASRPLGLLAGRVVIGKDFDDPLPGEILDAFQG